MRRLMRGGEGGKNGKSGHVPNDSHTIHKTFNELILKIITATLNFGTW